MSNINFLCEIGTEEIPAGYIPPAIAAAEKIMKEKLVESRVHFDEIRILATPRRLAILISNLADSQKAEEIEIKGPAKKAAYDQNDNPTKALEGFIKGNNITFEDIYTVDTEKGEYIFAKKNLKSQPTKDILPDIITNIVNGMPFPKKMRWADKAIQFPRPIAYFLIIFNNETITFNIEGIRSSNLTRGHYIQNNHMIEITDINTYEETLLNNNVIVDQNKRKEMIINDLRKAAELAGGSLIEDEELLDIVTYLVEFPNIVTCMFDENFLNIPDIALIAEMREHQKYFSIRNKNGSLSNLFLVTSNNPETPFIKEGNERVVSARFNDAKFFYDEDRKKSLADRVEGLKNVLFHKELGSIYQKIKRMQKISSTICEILKTDKSTSEKADRAIYLCKSDLETAMVNEFASLQGHMGKIYAIEDGEDPEVAEAIEQHYRPKFSGDVMPTNMVSIIASIAEKIDNIIGSYSVGNIPKGSQDPYALRRQAHAVVEMLIKNDINICLNTLLKSIADQYKEGYSLIEPILEFFSARAKTIYSDNGFRYDEIDACLSTNNADYLELFRRAQSIHNYRENPHFSEMLLSFKRMNNIVSAFRKSNSDYALHFSNDLLKETEEKELFNFFNSQTEAIKNHINNSSYVELFDLLIEGKSIIDNFFDKVLVMDEDTSIRDNRLYILESILSNFTKLLDFSKISDKE